MVIINICHCFGCSLADYHATSINFPQHHDLLMSNEYIVGIENMIIFSLFRIEIMHIMLFNTCTAIEISQQSVLV